MNKKTAARFEMLKKMSKSKSSEMHEPSIGEALKKKKMSKVTVMAEDEEGLKKGLTKAQQILKAKLGEKLGLENEDESEESDEEEDEEYSCPACEDAGCEECEED